MTSHSTDGWGEVLAQDIKYLETQQSGLAYQVERLQRLIDIDEKEARERRTNDLLNKLGTNAGLLNRVLAQLEMEDPDVKSEQEAEDYYRSTRRLRANTVSGRRKEARNLVTLERRKSSECPCGNETHKGVVFIDGKTEDGEDQIVDVLCPEHFWFKLNWLAFHDGTLSQFREKYPLEEFMTNYTK